MVASDQPPQVAAAAQRHRQTRANAHVLQVLGVQQGHAAQRAMRHVNRLAGVGVDQRRHLG